MFSFGDRQVTCCFTGHRPEKLPWRTDESDPACVTLKQRIAQALDSLYQEGYRHFICGMARGADTYFALAVLDLRRRCPDVILESAIPCPTQAVRWSAEDQARYQAILDQCNLESMVQHHYDRYCMLRRNRYMVDHASALLAVSNGSRGGTEQTIRYARERGLKILLLNPLPM